MNASRQDHRGSTAACIGTHTLRKGILVALASALLAAAPAAAHTIDVRRAAAAVKTEAENLGHVDRVTCWRPVVGTRRPRHRAMCVAWWVHTLPQACAVFYEVRMAHHQRRRLTVIQTFQPWCGWPTGPIGDDRPDP